MTQLLKLRELLGNTTKSDVILQFCLDCAKDIICSIRNSDDVEFEYNQIQLLIAIELFNKRGAEGEIAHNELGISRTYAAGDISPTLLSKITPYVRTPFSSVRVVN